MVFLKRLAFDLCSFEIIIRDYPHRFSLVGFYFYLSIGSKDLLRKFLQKNTLRNILPYSLKGLSVLVLYTRILVLRDVVLF